MRSLDRRIAAGAALAGALMLAGCGPSATDDAPDNLSSVGSTPSGIGGADTTGDRTDSLRYQENQQVGGDPRVDKIGVGAGSPNGGGIEGGTQNPDVLAPAAE